MAHYLIDGNNLIGKLKHRLPGFSKQQSRERLTTLLGGYFGTKKDCATVYFDGHESERLSAPRITFRYSGSKPADVYLKKAAEQATSPATTIVVSSDTEVRNYAKVCSCGVISSEEFAMLLEKSTQQQADDEADAAHKLSRDADVFKKLFGE